jgi:hypothetical protein
LVSVVDADDVRRIATSLPHTVEIDSDGLDFGVGNRGFVCSYPEHARGQRRVIRTDIAVLYVGDEAEKQALLLSEPEVFHRPPASSRQQAPTAVCPIGRVAPFGVA